MEIYYSLVPAVCNKSNNTLYKFDERNLQFKKVCELKPGVLYRYDGRNLHFRRLLELERILKIIALHEKGYGLRATMRKAGASDTAIKKYKRLYDEIKGQIEVKRIVLKK